MAQRIAHLIDASPYVFRAYFAVPDSIHRTPDGAPAHAVHGFASFLVRLANEERPTHAAIAFDESLTTSFRNDLYPDYKSSRGLPPPELEAQLQDCRAIARAMGFATLAHERFEADDLIGALCARVRAAGHGAVIVTSDKDLAQLVSDDVSLFDFAKQRRSGPAEVREKMGVRPDQVVDLLALCGDSVDDIPGVAGIGAKSASALLEAFDSLDGIYANLDAVADLSLRGARSLAKKLEADREAAFLSRKLARIVSDIDIDPGFDDLELTGVDTAQLNDVCTRLGFESLRDRILASALTGNH